MTTYVVASSPSKPLRVSRMKKSVGFRWIDDGVCLRLSAEGHVFALHDFYRRIRSNRWPLNRHCALFQKLGSEGRQHVPFVRSSSPSPLLHACNLVFSALSVRTSLLPFPIAPRPSNWEVNRIASLAFSTKFSSTSKFALSIRSSSHRLPC